MKGNSFAIILVVIFLLGCKNKNDRIEYHYSNNDFRYISFKNEIKDTLSKYISLIPDTCIILMKFDGSYTKNTFRLNVMTIKNLNNMQERLFYSYINKRKIYVSTGLEEMTTETNLKFIHCDDNLFVLYDSLGQIYVRENLNDYSDEFNSKSTIKFIPQSE